MLYFILCVITYVIEIDASCKNHKIKIQDEPRFRSNLAPLTLDEI